MSNLKALIKNGIIENVIIADNEFVESIKDDWDEIKDISDIKAGIGWEFNSSKKEFHSPQKNQGDKPVKVFKELPNGKYVLVPYNGVGE